MAPAGNRDSFLAAVAAGADAIYCGTKHFSARMQAINFTPRELKPLVDLAHDRGIKVFVTLNTLLKSDDLDSAGHCITQRSVNKYFQSQIRWTHPGNGFYLIDIQFSWKHNPIHPQCLTGQ